LLSPTITIAGHQRPGRKKGALFESPELLADAKKQKMDVDPESGENLEKLAAKTMNQPADVIARVKKLLGN